MIKLAICDDVPKICSNLEAMIMALLNTAQIPYEIDIFYTGEGLCDKLKDNTYDLIFLDIELPCATGIDVGKYIRETLNNDITQIAYISGKSNYAPQLFDSRPINFLVKPISTEGVKKVLDAYLRITEHNEQLFTYKKGRTYYNVPIKNILYFENSNRKIRIVTTDSEDEFYEHIEQIYEKVKEHCFLFIHKSYIVNYYHIKEISYDKVTMSNDQTMPISQANRNVIRDQYMELLRRNF